MSVTDYRDLLEPLQGSVPSKIIAELPRFMDLYRINTKLRLTHFLSQCAHESEGFRIVEENLNYGLAGLLETFPNRFPSEDFARRIARDPVAIGNFLYANINGNGNQASGDGYRFRGRGYIQLSQRNNYAAFNRVVRDDVVSNPDLVATDRYALWASAWYWYANDLNRIADRGPGNDVVSEITRVVNGPRLLGLTERQNYFDTFYADANRGPSAPLRPLQAGLDFGLGDYIGRVYRSVIQNVVINRTSNAGEQLYDIINSPSNITGRTLEDELQRRISSNEILATEDQLDGEIELLQFILNERAITETEIRRVTGTVGSFSLTEQKILISNGLIEFFPDRMRENMVRNSQEGGVNPNYSHAWRSPAKLAITADITIPGASGFRIGQIFWVDRTYENYKRYGAFQLFGLTETIDLGGWKTSLYARFNALTQRSVQTLVQSHDGLKITDSP